MDETWLHHYTPETKRWSAEWTAASESRPMRPKLQNRAGKVMTSIFWDAHGILFIDYLEKGKRKKCSTTKTMHRPQVHENDGQIE